MNKEKTRYHTEQGVIDILREFGYLETAEDGSVWFSTLGDKFLLDTQIDHKDIMNECDKIYRYLDNMGKDVYEACRNLEGTDAVKIVNAISEALNKKRTYRKGVLLGCCIGAVSASAIILLMRLLVR